MSNLNKRKYQILPIDTGATLLIIDIKILPMVYPLKREKISLNCLI